MCLLLRSMSCANTRLRITLYNNYTIADELVDPVPSLIAVVDDVLTTGAHFKAMKRILIETFPDVSVVGVFLARRVPNTE
jgi:predicted amidophosphoribosyltransferase